MFRIPKVFRWLAVALLTTFLAACGGGGGGGGGGGFSLNGGPVSGSVSITSATTASKTYTFNTVVDTAYTVQTSATSGTIFVSVYEGAVNINNLVHWNIFSARDAYSFIAGVTGTVTVVVQDANSAGTGSSYTLEAFDGNLSIGQTRSKSTFGTEQTKFHFDATAGTAYQVRLTPTTGDVSIGAVNAKLSPSIGSSAFNGADTMTFLAPASQRFYVRVDGTGVDSNYDLQVATTTADPDLTVSIGNAVSDGNGNVTISYTVRNSGLSATSGSFGVTGWSNQASAPAVGAVGTTSATHTGLAVGANVSGTLVIADAGNSGTAYVIVDTANAVVEATETNNVSAGRAWIKPVLAPQNFTFEDGLVPTALLMTGNANWSVDSSTGSASARSLKSGSITHNQSSCVTMTGANALSISFDYAVSSESGWDYLGFYIDGVESGVYSGAVTWTSTGVIPVSSGLHEYKWCYTKDGSVSSGSDTAWIDNIVLSPASVDLQVVVNSAVSNGSNVVVNYTVSNAGNSTAGPFNVAVWSNLATAPVVGATGQGSGAHASLAAGATLTGSVTIADTGVNGTAYAIVDTSNALIESNEGNNVSAGVVWTAPVVVASFNFEDGLVPAAMTMSGNAAWTNVVGWPTGSTHSLKAGTILDSQTSCVAVIASNSTAISFDYSVSSESGWDNLLFYIDGIQQQAWSGTVAWTASGVLSAGTAGSHEYKWCYTKDSTVSSGSDSAWIDNIVIIQ